MMWAIGQGDHRLVAAELQPGHQGTPSCTPTEQAAVGELDPLRPARGARGVEERGDVVGGRRHGAPERRGGRHLAGVAEHDGSAPASATTWSTSSGRICGFTGTAIPPARLTARLSRNWS